MKRLVSSLLLGSAVALAQHVHSPVENARPAELLEGLGSHTHPISTQSALAQKFFDQGLALINGSNHDETLWPASIPEGARQREYEAAWKEGTVRLAVDTL